MANPDLGKNRPVIATAATIKCLWCGGETIIRYRLPHIWHQPDDSRSYDVRWCEPCDFGFLDPRPTAEDQIRFNEQNKFAPVEAANSVTLFDRLRIHLAWRAGHSQARQIDARLVHTFLGKHGASICVFGCMQADVLSGLRDLEHRVVGVELNTDGCDPTQLQGIEIVSGSVEAPPRKLLGTAFDAIVLNMVLPVCREPRLALWNAHQMLKPDGALFVEVPNHGSYSARRFGPAWSLGDAGRHLNFFTDRSLCRFVESTGYDVKDILYRQYIPQFSGSRLTSEQQIWDSLYADRKRQDQRLPPRKSTVDLWTGLVCTAFLHPSAKYEIVGIIGTKRPGCATT